MLARCFVIVLLVTACLTCGRPRDAVAIAGRTPRASCARHGDGSRAKSVARRGTPAARPRRAADAVNSAVTVCSGVVVDARLVISPCLPPRTRRSASPCPGASSWRRAPRAGRVHGLTLLETDRDLPAKIVRTDDVPAVGSWVLSAAAWGTERPAVSVGILGASQRTLAGTSYPPLLQCDLRTAETSSGAGVVDSQGRLIGVVVATDAEHGNRGWTYAVPATHIQRLLTVRSEERNRSAVVILKRRRPVIGMVLDGEDQTVVVSRVIE
jgi:hypothetical protein